MSSPLDDVIASERRERSTTDVFVLWNRRLHYFLGLYLLFFCWLFVFTGLLLNHSRWQLAQFWPNRVQTTTEHQFQVPLATTDVERARELMQQLGIAGEIQWRAGAIGLRAVRVSGESTGTGHRGESGPQIRTCDAAAK